jgi:hypothetical protein
MRLSVAFCLCAGRLQSHSAADGAKAKRRAGQQDRGVPQAPAARGPHDEDGPPQDQLRPGRLDRGARTRRMAARLFRLTDVLAKQR